jgi:hypothetical protein
MSNKGLVSIIQKELPKFNSEKKHPIRNWVKDMKRHLTKDDVQMTEKCMKKCPTSFNTKDVQIESSSGLGI